MESKTSRKFFLRFKLNSIKNREKNLTKPKNSVYLPMTMFMIYFKEKRLAFHIVAAANQFPVQSITNKLMKKFYVCQYLRIFFTLGATKKIRKYILTVENFSKANFS